MKDQSPGLLAHLTQKANLKQTRYGWLRLTPAHSVHLIAELLEQQPIPTGAVLDPFCGTGTTALVCAERGISCDTTDINPFLLWLTAAKTRSYSPEAVAAMETSSAQIAEAMVERGVSAPAWTPLLHQIEKWWDEPTRGALGRARHRITALSESLPAATTDLLKVAFCRVLIERASVSFGHQSMSFKQGNDELTLFPEEVTLESWRCACQDIARAAGSPIVLPPRALLLDARRLSCELPRDHYACVITSPPYPNRMSYIRELRPYMYWLGYLNDGRQAGELDWQAIGGTWGCATSNLAKWEPTGARCIPYDGFEELLTRIAERSCLLSRYVHKYFCDMAEHVGALFAVVKPGGSIHYIVGNSKFYDVLLPVERIFAALFSSAGFTAVTVKTIRKRTSKKELFEYIVSARKP